MTAEWTVDMSSDVRGHSPIRGRFDSLSIAKFAAIDAAIRHQLAKQGIGLAGTAWLKPLEDGRWLNAPGAGAVWRSCPSRVRPG